MRLGRGNALVVPVALLAVALAACSGDDDAADSSGSRAESAPKDGGPAAARRTTASPGPRRTVFVGARPGIPVEAIAFGDRLVRPATLETSDEALATGLTWEDWGRPAARGRGVVRINTCEPNCARGRVVRRPGLRAELGAVRAGSCKGREVHFYTRAVVEWPPGLGLPPREGFRLLPRCTEVD
jgi:hypothetical protein